MIFSNPSSKRHADHIDYRLLFITAFIILSFVTVTRTSGQTYDLALQSLSMPSALCATNSDVYVRISNLQGNAPVTSVTINWSANGVAQTAFVWTGSIMGTDWPEFKIGEVASEGPDVTISATVSLTNGGADMRTSDDALTKTFQRGLAGTYTAGGADPDFPTPAAATERLSSAGVCGPVTINIRDGVYDGQLTLRSIVASSSDKPIVLQSESQDANAVTIMSSVHLAGAIVQAKASYITINKISILNSANNQSSIELYGGVQGIKIIDNIFTSTDNTSDVMIGLNAYTSEIIGNTITGGARGILMIQCADLRIQNNTIADSRHNGLNIISLWNSSFDKNIIYSNDPEYQSGMAFTDVIQSKATGNRIDVPRCGLSVASGWGNLLSNNVVRVQDDGSDNIDAYGAKFHSAHLQFFHNTIRVQDLSTGSAAVEIHYPSGEFFNNVFVNEGEGSAIKMGLRATFFQSDYNNIFSNGPHLFERKLSSTSAATTNEGLDKYSILTGLERRSISVDPDFISHTDFHPQALDLAAMGTPTSVLTDFDGEPRDATLPTLGADEFGATAPNDLSAYRNFAHDLCNPIGTHDLILRNTGSNEISSIKVSWSVNDKPEEIVQWTGSLTRGDELRLPLTFTFGVDTVQNIRVEVNEVNGAADTRSFHNQKEYGFIRYSKVDLGPSRNVCLNGASSITLQPLKHHFTSYTWNNGQKTDSISVSTSGYYGLTAFDLNGCYGYDDTYVTLIDVRPTIAVEADYICPDDYRIMYAKTSSSCKDCSYQWYRDNAMIPDATSSSHFNETAGEFKVAVTRSGCTEFTAPKTISMHYPVKPVVIVDSDTICKGERATLSAPQGYMAYWWLGGGYGRTISTDTTGTFLLTVSDGKCLIDSDSIKIRVVPSTSITMFVDGVPRGAGEVIACHDSPIQLRASVLGASQIRSYTWTKNGVVVSGENSPLLSVSDDGAYSVTVAASPCDVSTPSVIQVKRGTVPAAPIVQAVGSTTLCEGGSVTLKTDDAEPVTYQWLKDDKIIPFANARVLTASEPGNYQLSKFNGYCSSVSPSTTVTQILVPKPVVAQPEPVCAGTTVTLDAPTGFDSYEWSSDESTRSISTTKNGVYSVTVTKAGCKSPRSNSVNVVIKPLPIAVLTQNGMTLTASGGPSYEWLKDGVVVSGETGAMFQAEAAGQYQVRVTVNNCSAISNTVTLVVTGTETEKKGMVEMYPNPATEYFYVRGVDLTKRGTYYKLFDGLGKEIILQPHFTSDELMFNIGDLSAGIHYFVVYRHFADIIVLKFVVQKSN